MVIEERVPLSIRVPSTLATRARQVAGLHGQTVTRWIEKLIQDAVNQTEERFRINLEEAVADADENRESA